MNLVRQLPWILLLVSIVANRLLPSSTADSNKSDEVIRAKQIEVVDSNGAVRIVMATDADGSAKVVFKDPARKTESSITQRRTGAMSIQFAGPQGMPSVILESDFDHGGPRLFFRGNTWPGQRVLLGFHTDDLPSETSRIWGLFFPSLDGVHNLSGIGVSRDSKTGMMHGFVLPIQ
jgi:hypothetical protein